MIFNEQFKGIYELDLEPIKVKLMHVESGEGWSLEKANAVEIAYRRFLVLMKKYPSEQTAPLVDVDTFWHYHILDTMKYASDCAHAFGYFLHHFPYIGLRGADDAQAHARAGERMRELYEDTFGEAYDTGAQAGGAFCGGLAGVAFCGAASKAQSAFCGVASKPAYQGKASASAFCGVSTAPAKVAFCGLITPSSKTAFCGIAPPAAKSAFCGTVTAPGTARLAGIAPPARATAFCGTNAKAAFCGTNAKASFCGTNAKAAFCGIATKAAIESMASSADFYAERPRLTQAA
ncbi:MAG: hypothetical protein V4582_21525 [Pseudomonadota bacterium]